MTTQALGNDIVADAEAAAAAPRPPLLVLDAVAAFLDEHGIGRGPLRAFAIGEGHSNLTYELVRDDIKVVLRRPPRPPLPPSAHDVVREARILQALADSKVRVPKVLAVCEDPGVLGVPFFVMEHLDGVVLSDQLPPTLHTRPSRTDLAYDLVQSLVEVHDVDPTVLSGRRVRPDYLQRQIQRFSGLWSEVRTRDLAEVDRVARWLGEHVPRSQTTTVVHGDFRLGNAMLHRSRPQVLAILDWEMATVGDPLADLGYLCATWAQQGEGLNAMTRLSAATTHVGFPSRSDLAQRYATSSGRFVEDLRFYEVLALFRAAVFFESSYRRFLEGRTDDKYFAELNVGVPELGRAAWTRTTQGNA